jgi:hypothetical protein
MEPSVLRISRNRGRYRGSGNPLKEYSHLTSFPNHHERTKRPGYLIRDPNVTADNPPVVFIKTGLSEQKLS